MKVSALALAIGFTAFGFGMGALAIDLVSKRPELASRVRLSAPTNDTQQQSNNTAAEAFTARAFVSVVRPKRESYREETEIVALVSPRSVASAHFLVPGKVEACRVRPSDSVAAGEELCRLDRTVVALERERARQGVRSTERAIDEQFLARQKSLYETGVIGQGDYERVRVEAERAFALRDDARTALALADKKGELHTLRAPFAGKVVEVRAQRGMPIGPEIAAVILSSAGAVVIKAEIPARYWAKVHKGTELRVTSVASEPVDGEGLLFRAEGKAPAVSVERQAFETEFAAAAPLRGAVLAPGMLVSGKLLLAKHEAALVLPFEALTRWESGRGEAEVLVREPRTGRVRAARIRASAPTDGWVRLVDGLDEATEIVSPVPASLREGDLTERASSKGNAP